MVTEVRQVKRTVEVSKDSDGLVDKGTIHNTYSETWVISRPVSKGRQMDKLYYVVTEGKEVERMANNAGRQIGHSGLNG